MRRGAVLLGVALAAGAPSGCAKLQPIKDGVCGNFVVDFGEDCDTYALSGGACAPPGAEHACRYTCNLDADCPQTYGCGLDGVCRRASPPEEEHLSPLGPPVPFPLLRQVATADLDADGASEVVVFESADALGRRSARVLGPRASPPKVVPLPVSMTAAAIDRLAGDSHDNIAFADIGGVLLLRGSADLRGELVAYPSLVPAEGTRLRTVPLEVIPTSPGHEIIAFIQAPDKNTVLVRPQGQLPQAILCAVPGSEESIAGDVVRSRFDESLPCEAIAFGLKGGDRAFHFTPCQLKGSKGVEWRIGTALQEVLLPEGRTIEGGVLTADANGDGHKDLLIGGDDGGLLVAWGNGDGTFTSSSGVPASASPFTPAPIAGTEPTFPLAVTDLDGDGAADYVLSTGLFLASGDGKKPAYGNVGAPWTVAVAADMNDNGLIDIAAASKESLNVDFLNNAGGGVWNPFVLTTDGGVTHLATGDFDGDLVIDLGMSESVAVTSLPESHVEVAFGNLAGPPDAPVEMASLVQVGELYSAELPPPSAAYGVAGTDKVSDLVITSKTPESGTDRAFELRGNGARALTGSLSLQTPEGRAVRPIALATGYFGDPIIDIAALGADVLNGELYLFRVESAYEVKLDETRASDVLPGELHALADGPVAALHYGALLGGADLNNDGTTELIVVAPAGPSDDGAAVVIADYDPSAYRFHPREALPITLRLGRDSSISTADVDGDGSKDAVIVGGDHESPAELVILWNDGKGNLDTAHPTRLSPDDGSGVTGAVCVPGREDAGCILYLTTKSGTYRALVPATHHPQITRIEGLGGGIDIASGDFDGDGVPDIAIGHPTSLTLYRRAPELP